MSMGGSLAITLERRSPPAGSRATPLVLLSLTPLDVFGWRCSLSAGHVMRKGVGGRSVRAELCAPLLGCPQPLPGSLCHGRLYAQGPHVQRPQGLPTPTCWVRHGHGVSHPSNGRPLKAVSYRTATSVPVRLCRHRPVKLDGPHGQPGDAPLRGPRRAPRRHQHDGTTWCTVVES